MELLQGGMSIRIALVVEDGQLLGLHEVLQTLDLRVRVLLAEVRDEVHLLGVPHDGVQVVDVRREALEVACGVNKRHEGLLAVALECEAYPHVGVGFVVHHYEGLDRPVAGDASLPVALDLKLSVKAVLPDGVTEGAGLDVLSQVLLRSFVAILGQVLDPVLADFLGYLDRERIWSVLDEFVVLRAQVQVWSQPVVCAPDSASGILAVGLLSACEHSAEVEGSLSVPSVYLGSFEQVRSTHEFFTLAAIHFPDDHHVGN